jgi:aldehyde:ferredoxin oxidoreductase
VTPLGYGGRTLRADLTSGRVRAEKTDPELLLASIGGRGLNSLRLHRELDRSLDPLSPDSLLLLAVGPLTGSLLTASAYFTISGRSPLTGILGDSAAGGHFGPELKAAGWDQLVITGRAERPCWLLLADERAELRDAGRLWGLDTWQTARAIKAELGDPAVQVAAIGPAGENLVKFASVASSGSRMSGRTGMGALFGSKNLKAVAVRGTGGVRPADPEAYQALCRQIDGRILAHPELEKRRALGTTMLMSALNGIGILPTDHFQKGVCSYLERVSGERLAERYKVKNKSCFNCNVHCSRYFLTPSAEGEGPEFETLCTYTSRLGNDDLEFALRMTNWLNRMGMDSVSSGETIGWAMECVQRGLLTAAHLDGLEFTWGNKATIERILQMIVRREGIGGEFAEGTRHLARRFGRGTEEYAFQVKGLDIICGDPRGIKAYGLTYAIASRGGDHLRAEPFFELTGRYEEAERRYGTRDAADRLSENGKAALVVYSERLALLVDCLTMCKNIGLCMDILDFDTAARLLSAATGLPFTPERVDEALQGVLAGDRLLNLDFGLDPAEDTLPRRFVEEALAEGPTRGCTVDIRRMVREYYRLKGWDERGRPA